MKKEKLRKRIIKQFQPINELYDITISDKLIVFQYMPNWYPKKIHKIKIKGIQDKPFIDELSKYVTRPWNHELDLWKEIATYKNDNGSFGWNIDIEDVPALEQFLNISFKRFWAKVDSKNYFAALKRHHKKWLSSL